MPFRMPFCYAVGYGISVACRLHAVGCMPLTVETACAVNIDTGSMYCRNLRRSTKIIFVVFK